jgi:hypothetical protein
MAMMRTTRLELTDAEPLQADGTLRGDADELVRLRVLQRNVGNRAVARLLRQPKPPAKKPAKPVRAATLDEIAQEIGPALGGPYADFAAYAATMEEGTFLGHAIESPGQPIKGVRPEFQKKLDAAQVKIDAEFKASGNPIPSGYGIDGVGGFRWEASMHGAGMAIDIDAGKNPYIMHSAGAAALDAELKPVFHRIAEFILNDPIDGEQSIIPKIITTGSNLPASSKVSRHDRLGQYYDRLARESDAMREYFRLMKDGAALTAFLAGPWLTAHPGATAPPVAEIVHQMWEDYAALGGAIPTGGPPGVPDFTKPPARGRPFHPTGMAQKDPAAGFLTIPREVVVGLGQAVGRWGPIDFGAESGDVMHFDDRYALGKPFDDARVAANAKLKAAAEAAAATPAAE